MRELRGLLLMTIGNTVLIFLVIKFFSTIDLKPVPRRQPGFADNNLNFNISDFVAVATARSVNNTIFVVSVDTSFTELAVNLNATLFKKYNIKNYVFASTGYLGCMVLRENGIFCYWLYDEVTGNSQYKSFSWPEFLKKGWIKTELTYILLRAGLDVVMVDSDISFLQDPRPYLHCDSCDIIISTEKDASILNIGFYYIKSNSRTILMQQKCMQIGHSSGGKLTWDQKVFNSIVSVLSLKVVRLSELVFTDGLKFLMKAQFNTPCPGCVMVHATYLKTPYQKSYAFKENLLWKADMDGYYTSTTTRYMMYENPKSASTVKQKEALLVALAIGKVLKRVVILPKFTCHKINNLLQTYSCNLHHSLGLGFIEPKYHNKFRENSFLLNPMVPKEVLSSISPVMHVNIKKDVWIRSSDDILLNDESYGNFLISGLQDCISQNYTILKFQNFIV